MREGKKDTTQGAQWICDTANSDIMHMLNQLQATATGLLRLMSKCMGSQFLKMHLLVRLVEQFYPASYINITGIKKQENESLRRYS